MHSRSNVTSPPRRKNQAVLIAAIRELRADRRNNSNAIISPSGESHPVSSPSSHGAACPETAVRERHRLGQPNAITGNATGDFDQPQQNSSFAVQNERSYLGKSGYLPIFSQPGPQENNALESYEGNIDVSGLTLTPILKQSFAETFMEFCFPWCPVLDRTSIFEGQPFAESVLLQQALALLGSRINPPVVEHEKSRTYYERMKTLFHKNQEHNTLVRIISIILVYWWSAGPPNVVSMESQFWWTSIAIRLGQEIGLYREVTNYHTLKPGESLGLRRRARERLTSICQGRPCIINPDDCDVHPPSLEDFPADHTAQAEIFIHWVNICDIIGQVSTHLARRTDATPFPFSLAQRLIDWVHQLPVHLQLPFLTSRTKIFDRHIHQLHLPYLTAITLLYMNTSAQPLPKAYTAAILAASCVARIFQDYLTRGSLRFLPGMAGWYISIAALALLHARQVECLRDGANEQLDVLFLALKEMSKLWHSSKMFLVGFEKLLNGLPPNNRSGRGAAHSITVSALTDLTHEDGINYLDFFPGTSSETSQVFMTLLTHSPPSIFMETEWANDLSIQLQDLFDQPFDSVDFDSLIS
ncbi:uncharacterized protein Z518_07368 [Rhinocladiella mackenziei CBS 650.93]|uniref:Transcription factor domain-containing protein n=1 Tax=Rhinocladiella mackenziei CBS 650.93 TaxID=1442369 RepID=A0A0D2J477_9EURO|nr:uncharacterized protein Z518_07368 [Rhinocladiella mackenziei CBS 650.93]KIX03815.1 hypothetical protein Z518_07368 [Rhinocladiella mackenziei CBS 650.93]